MIIDIDDFKHINDTYGHIFGDQVIRRVAEIMQADIRKIGILNDLRHSAATNLLNMGFTIKDVSVWLGHADITTTLNIYSHVLDESKSEMASALWSGKRVAS